MTPEVFHFEDGKENFENHSNENGFTYWSARKLMIFLGYSNWNTFNKVISKAMATCNTLSIPLIENFEQIHSEIEGRLDYDFKLSRFACYLIAMNGNVAMPQVAKAQAYFATIAGAIQDYQLEAEKVERLQVRAEVSEREKTLSGVAFAHGLDTAGYGFFQNAGYRGMYNKNISTLKTIRGINKNRSLLDFMGKDELAANLFRITQTELKIKGENVRGQSRLEQTAENVGRQVRKAMMEISNVAPENLSSHEDIKQVKKSLKETNKNLKKLNKKAKK
ncbi:MAG TPA: BRO family protein [Flavipsychrobacter sp.]